MEDVAIGSGSVLVRVRAGSSLTTLLWMLSQQQRGPDDIVDEGRDLAGLFTTFLLDRIHIGLFEEPTDVDVHVLLFAARAPFHGLVAARILCPRVGPLVTVACLYPRQLDSFCLLGVEAIDPVRRLGLRRR